MPKSRVRKKKTDNYVRSDVVAAPKRKQPSPAWYGALVLGTMLIGVAWLVTYYVSNAALPIDDLRAWNVLVGFAWIALGFALSTQWR